MAHRWEVDSDGAKIGRKEASMKLALDKEKTDADNAVASWTTGPTWEVPSITYGQLKKMLSQKVEGARVGSTRSVQMSCHIGDTSGCADEVNIRA